MAGKRILLVDDEIVILKTLGNFLEGSGFKLETAVDYSGAIQAFCLGRFDLVITDLRLNGKTGIELSIEIRKMKPQCGIFILTGQASISLAIEALRAGADDFLLKPCDTDELLLRMARFFEKQDAIRKLKLYEAFLPICMYCKRIRDENRTESEASQWLNIEDYFWDKGTVSFTHGCCPDCYERILQEWKHEEGNDHEQEIAASIIQGENGMGKSRTFARVDGHGVVVLSGMEQPVLALIEDISLGGFSFSCSEDLTHRLHTTISMEIMLYDTLREYECLLSGAKGKIVSIQSDPHHRGRLKLRYGVKFHNLMPENSEKLGKYFLLDRF